MTFFLRRAFLFLSLPSFLTFVIPLARNTREFLRRQHSHLMWYHQSESEIFEYFRDRWMLPRVAWDKRFASWSKDDWAIWLQRENGRG